MKILSSVPLFPAVPDQPVTVSVPFPAREPAANVSVELELSLVLRSMLETLLEMTGFPKKSDGFIMVLGAMACNLPPLKTIAVVLEPIEFWRFKTRAPPFRVKAEAFRTVGGH